MKEAPLSLIGGVHIFNITPPESHHPGSESAGVLSDSDQPLSRTLSDLLFLRILTISRIKPI